MYLLYDHFTDVEKKEFMTAFIERIETYPERLPNGRILKHIEFRFPVFFGGQEITGIGWDTESTVYRSTTMKRYSCGM